MDSSNPITPILPLTQLRGYALNVRCPACHQEGRSIIAEDSFPWWMLRLAVFTGENTRVHVNEAHLIDAPLGADIEIFHRYVSSLKIAPSPLGLPSPWSEECLRPLKRRYTTLKPVQTLAITLDGIFGFPTRVVDDKQRERRMFQIAAPGIPTCGRLYLLDKCAWMTKSCWDPAEPHFRVSAYDPAGDLHDMVLVQLFKETSWGIVLHSVNRGGDTTGEISFEQPYISRKSSAPHFDDWAKYRPDFIWISSAGPLLWSNRTIVDGESGRLLCLMDAYDRLLAVMRKSPTRPPGVSMCEMRLYAEISEQLVGEILASYTALICQQVRDSQEPALDG